MNCCDAKLSLYHAPRKRGILSPSGFRTSGPGPHGLGPPEHEPPGHEASGHLTAVFFVMTGVAGRPAGPLKKAMRLGIITPAPAGSRSGNRVTAERWARLLRKSGHRLTIETHWNGGPCDALIAIHALKSFDSIQRFHRERPGDPLIVGLAGTDLYHDLGRSRRARRALEWASRIVVLHPKAPAALPARLRGKTRVIVQSSPARRRASVPRSRDRDGVFRVAVIGHLRPVKDPFRTALAARRLPLSSRIRVLHLGRALHPSMEARARREMARNPRYLWLGEVSHARALRILDGSRLLVVTSLTEGGANVVSEALAGGVSVLSSRIDGSVGILGSRYPGLFPVGDTPALARLLVRCESDPRFHEKLARWCARRAPLTRPAREQKAWKNLLSTLPVARTTR